MRSLRDAIPGLTQEALAGHLGVHTRTVQNWEQGFVIPRSKMPLLARELRTTPDVIRGDEPVPVATR